MSRDIKPNIDRVDLLGEGGGGGTQYTSVGKVCFKMAQARCSSMLDFIQLNLSTQQPYLILV